MEKQIVHKKYMKRIRAHIVHKLPYNITIKCYFIFKLKNI